MKFIVQEYCAKLHQEDFNRFRNEKNELIFLMVICCV